MIIESDFRDLCTEENGLTLWDENILLEKLEELLPAERLESARADMLMTLGALFAFEELMPQLVEQPDIWRNLYMERSNVKRLVTEIHGWKVYLHILGQGKLHVHREPIAVRSLLEGYPMPFTADDVRAVDNPSVELCRINPGDMYCLAPNMSHAHEPSATNPVVSIAARRIRGDIRKNLPEMSEEDREFLLSAVHSHYSKAS